MPLLHATRVLGACRCTQADIKIYYVPMSLRPAEPQHSLLFGLGSGLGEGEGVGIGCGEGDGSGVGPGSGEGSVEAYTKPHFT